MQDVFSGFEKRALQRTLGRELALTAGTSLLPFGTTGHTISKDSKGGDSGLEWVSRMGLGTAGSLVGGAVGGPLGALAGHIGGEVGGNYLVHGHKYDKDGKLKAQYKS